MKQNTVTFWITFFAVFVALFHLALKERPELKEVEEFSQGMESPLKWQGKVAPYFEIKTMDGKEWKLADHVGREVIVLNFFATWCGPCKKEMPELNRYYNENRDRGFLLIGIDAGESKTMVEKFVKDLSVDFPVGIDRSGKLRKMYGVNVFPTTVLIGVDGTIGLYEIGQIENADVAFSRLYEESLTALESGEGITPEAFRAASAAEDYSDVLRGGRRDKGGDEPLLEGRALAIAEKMDCTCGCTSKVADCVCSTAVKIRKKLAGEDLGGRKDSEVIKELNREFCIPEDS